MREEQFRQRLMATFKVEAEEYIREILKDIENLETTLEEQQVAEIDQIEASYRQFHSLKGAAQAIGFNQVGQICQKAESILSGWKSNPNSANLTDLQKVIELSISAANELHVNYPGRGNEGIDRSLTADADSTATPQMAETKKEPFTTAANVADSASTNKVDKGAETPASSSIPSGEANKSAEKGRNGENTKVSDVSKVHLSHLMSIGTTKATETIRISSSKLDSLLRRGEQLVLARINSLQRYNEAMHLLGKMAEMRQAYTIAVGNTEDYRFNDNSFRIMNDMHRLVRNLASDHHELDSQLTALLEEVKRARLAPVRPLMEDLEIAARRIARQLGKKVRITIYGNELELDRSIMEALKDPLTHLVRNALDHGLESPEDRLQANKPIEGHLTIGIRTHGTSTMEFIVSDDGRGIQTEEVIEAAKRQGLIADGVAVDTLDLIFSSGVSTRKKVSNISGRGLGMAIVRDKVEALKGSVRVKTRVGEGTTFELSMPTSFATFNGLLIREFGRDMVIPLNGIEAVAHFYSTDVRSIEGSQVVDFRNTIIPLSRLGSLLGLNEAPGHVVQDPCQAIIVTAGGRKAAFLLDQINGVHEVLTRDLGPQLKKLRFIIGACMIGYQKVVPVLNVADLLTFVRGATPNKLLKSFTPVRHLLVVDDSLTTRTLMRELLENANYQVTIAVDGLQAWDKLQKENFDLLVSDVDMPGMTGFDLTNKIRSSRELKNLPIVLVTGKEKQEDKQRGLNLGASAYILKSTFDEGSLLDTVESLIGTALPEE